MSALDVVRDALRGTGIDLAASCTIEAYDARAPGPLRSASLMPSARGVIVVASAGRSLWAALERDRARDPSGWHVDHPLDAYVARVLDHAGRALDAASIASRRFEPTLGARPALSFRALGELVGLGSMGPFGLLIHDVHGPWWALRGAFLVDVAVDPPQAHAPPCAGCAAPCVAGGKAAAGAIALATPEVRGRCVVGQASRYDDTQIAYHHDREPTLARLRARTAC